MLTIPDEVVEAAAKEIYDCKEQNNEHLSKGEFKFRPWETISAGERATYFPLARTAIAAALNAWSGRWLSDGMQNLVLPLHTGARDE